MNAITIHRNALESAVGRCKAVAQQRTQKPITRYLLVQCDGKQAAVTANNTECAVRLTIPCEGGLGLGGAAFLLDCEKAGGFLSLTREERITIQPHESGVALMAGRSKLSLNCPDVEEFPAMDAPPSGPHVTVDAPALLEGIQRAEGFYDESNSRFAFGGMFWDFSEGEFALVTTNGHAISRALIGHERQGEMASVVAPGRSVAAIKPLLEAAGKLTVTPTPNLLWIAGERFVFAARLIDGRFPRWRDVLCECGKDRASVLAGELTAAIKRAALVKDEETNAVKFSFSKDSLEVTGPKVETGESQSSIPCTTDGEIEPFQLNPKYALAALRSIPGEMLVTIEVVGPAGAMTKFTTEAGHCSGIMQLAKD